MRNLTPPYDQYSLLQLQDEVKNRGLRVCSDQSEHAHLVAMLTGNDVFVASIRQALGLSHNDPKKSLKKFFSDS